MKKFVYADCINLDEEVRQNDGSSVRRYGPRLNPVKDENGIHQPLESGQLFDRLNPMREIFPTSYRRESAVMVTTTGNVIVRQREFHLPGGVYAD